MFTHQSCRSTSDLSSAREFPSKISLLVRCFSLQLMIVFCLQTVGGCVARVGRIEETESRPRTRTGIGEPGIQDRDNEAASWAGRHPQGTREHPWHEARTRTGDRRLQEIAGRGRKQVGSKGHVVLVSLLNLTTNHPSMHPSMALSDWLANSCSKRNKVIVLQPIGGHRNPRWRYLTLPLWMASSVCVL